MKKTTLLTLCAIAALMFTSCGKIDEKSFVGTWGVEKIEYYNIDYAGNPIGASMSTFNLVPGDQQSGIDLIFREDKTGEMRDRSQDTLKLDWNNETETYETIIICPDTTLVTKFTYSVDKSASILYMNLENPVKTYKMNIVNMTKDSFIYENEYGTNYVEKAYMKRLSNTPSKSGRSSQPWRPRREGSFLSGK